MNNGTVDQASAVALAPDPVVALRHGRRSREQVVKVYGRGATEVQLDHVDVVFVEGEFCAIMGPSGSGKSTLLRCMAELDRRTGGRALIGDTDLSRLDDKALTILRAQRHRVRLPELQPRPHPDRGRNIRLPLALGRRSGDAAWIARSSARLPRDHRSIAPGAVWRAATAGRGGRHQLVAYASSSPTNPRGNPDPGQGAAVLGLLRGCRGADGPDGGDGHSRSGCCQLRPASCAPRRWPSRRRDASAEAARVLDRMSSSRPEMPRREGAWRPAWAPRHHGGGRCARRRAHGWHPRTDRHHQQDLRSVVHRCVRRDST